MPFVEWPLYYEDARGTEKTMIRSDGSGLMVVLRNFRFTGTSFDGLEPDMNTGALLYPFAFCLGCLCDCKMSVSMELRLLSGKKEIGCHLAIVLALGRALPNNALDRASLDLCLSFEEEKHRAMSSHCDFEEGLLGIQRQLPADFIIKACINCLYSDYSPLGNGSFGCMMCFRNIKEEYLRVHSKAEFFDIEDRFERWVQETHCCPDFVERLPGTGYRG
jgi:hypothetical protein